MHIEDNNNSKKYQRLKIVQLDRKNNFVKLWDSANQIEKDLNMNRSAILRCCRGIQNKSYWFIWMFEKDYKKSNH